MTALEAYLARLAEIRSSGEAHDETSYYGALENLFNQIGKQLKPEVVCNIQLKNRGAGMPDGGLFTKDQLKSRRGEAKPLPQLPARGVVEVKPTKDDAWVTADSEQVSRYWARHGQVLVTNYRDFVFVGKDPQGKPVKLETYRLAGSEKEFWAAAAHPKKTAETHAEMFEEFAKRAMLHAAPITSPEDLAWFLASYARDALHRIGLHDLPGWQLSEKRSRRLLASPSKETKANTFSVRLSSKLFSMASSPPGFSGPNSIHRPRKTSSNGRKPLACYAYPSYANFSTKSPIPASSKISILPKFWTGPPQC